MDSSVLRRLKVAFHYLISYTGIVLFPLNLHHMIDFSHMLITGTDASYTLLASLAFVLYRKCDHDIRLLRFFFSIWTGYK
jgi:hypothetical protein